MFRFVPRALLLAGVALAATACQENGPVTTAPGYYQPPPPPPRHATPYYGPAPVYARPAPAYYYGNQPAYYGNPYANPPGSHGWYNRADGRRYTTVTVTNRGQNGYRDDIVRQQVVCGSQYYDGYQTRTAPSC